MDLIRLLIATALLACAGQSQALFMPEGFKIDTDASASTDQGCGLIDTVPESLSTY